MFSDEIRVNAYCGWSHHSYGVFLNGERVYDPENTGKTQNYEFKLFLELGSNFDPSDPILKENLTFFAELNVTDYVEEKTLDWGKAFGNTREVETFTVVRYDKIAQEFAPKEFQYLSERLRRLRDFKVREPVIYDPDTYMGGNEFFEFTKETACSWGGPFQFNGVEGCVAVVTEGENEIATMKPINIQQDWGYWQLPDKFRAERSDLKDSEIYHMNGESRAELFLTFPASVQFAIAKKILNLWNEQNCIWLQAKLPFKIGLYGNDDTSYTKYFATKQEMEDELNYLRAMQPLDIVRDVYDRGYEFTN